MMSLAFGRLKEKQPAGNRHGASRHSQCPSVIPPIDMLLTRGTRFRPVNELIFSMAYKCKTQQLALLRFATHDTFKWIDTGLSNRRRR